MTGPEIDKALLRKGVALLGRRSFSRGDLGGRLARYGEPESVEAVLDRLEQLNLLNDADYAYNSACRWMRQEGWGPLKVRHRLARQKIPEAIAETAVERACQILSETGALEAYLDRRTRTSRLPDNRKGIDKLFKNLLRRGYDSETIRNVLRDKIPSSAWQDFDTGD